jgi:biotin-(acetyl-CoA carboxylase) ligase
MDIDRLLAAFLERIEAGVDAVRAGRFDAAGWASRQVTTGRAVRLETAAGVETVLARGVDSVTGALLVADPTAGSGDRPVLVGEVIHVRLAAPIAAGV